MYSPNCRAVFCTLWQRPTFLIDVSSLIAQTVEQVQAAESAGFGTAWFTEHHFSNYSMPPSPLLMVGHVAPQTLRIKLGTAVVLPALYPFIFATIRISFGVAWKVALTAELFGGDTGLGYLLNLARQDFDMPMILVVIIVIILFVYSSDRWVFAPMQARLARHHAALG